MSWMHGLLDTYNAIFGEDGYEQVVTCLKNNKVPLLPIFHTMRKCDIEIAIDSDGSVNNIIEIDKNNADTVTPCTEASAGRTGQPIPNGIVDQAKYIIRNISPPTFNESYVDQLQRWESWECSKNIRMVLRAIRLASSNDEIERIYEERFGKKIKPDACIRWRVRTDSYVLPHEDAEFFRSWVGFVRSNYPKEQILCSVTGEYSVPSRIPLKVTNNAKIVSSKHKYNQLDYCGEKSACVGIETMWKISLCLKYLISKRQGLITYDDKERARIAQAVFCWNPANQSLENPLSVDLVDFDDEGFDAEKNEYKIDETYASNLRRAVFSDKIPKNEQQILSLTISDGNGRMQILHYAEIPAQQFYKNILEWKRTCSNDGYSPILVGQWREYDDKKWYVAGIVDAAKATFRKNDKGQINVEITDKLKSSTIQRLLPCIMEGAPLPYDICLSAIRQLNNVRNTIYFDQMLNIVCALINKHEFSERINTNMEDKYRSYLIGAFCAVCDEIEREAKRIQRKPIGETNARKFFVSLQQNPSVVYQHLFNKVQPYYVIISKKYANVGEVYDSYFHEIAKKLNGSELEKKSANSQFILGFYDMRKRIREDRDARIKEAEAARAAQTNGTITIDREEN